MIKSETDILGELDALLAQLPDDAARERAFAWLRSKHAPKPATKPEPAPTVNPFPLGVPPGIVYPFVPPPPVIEREPHWPGTLEITCEGAVSFTTDKPVRRPPEFFREQAQGAQIQVAEGWTSFNAPSVAASNPVSLGNVWVGKTRPSDELLALAFSPNAGNAGCNPIIPQHSITIGGPNAYPSHVHVGSSAH